DIDRALSRCPVEFESVVVIRELKPGSFRLPACFVELIRKAAVGVGIAALGGWEIRKNQKIESVFFGGVNRLRQRNLGLSIRPLSRDERDLNMTGGDFQAMLAAERRDLIERFAAA